MTEKTAVYAVAEYIESEMVHSTRNGLSFLAFGILVSGIPLVRPIGALIALAGAIWLIEGREVFGRRHSNGAIAGFALYAVGLAFVLVGSISFLLFVVFIPGTEPSHWPGNDYLVRAIALSYTTILWIDVVGSIFTGAAVVFFAFPLHNFAGRVVLIIGLLSSVIADSAVISILSSDLGPLTYRYGPNGPGGYDSAAASIFASQAFLTNLINVIPAGILAAAYLSLRSRIDRVDLTPLRSKIE